VKLYIWEEVLCDYKCGMIVALAPDLESAMAAEPIDYVRAEMGRVSPKVIEINPDVQAQTWHVYGG